MPEVEVMPPLSVSGAQTLRIGETINTGNRGVRGLVAGAAAETQGGTMPRAELLEAVKAFRDERGRMHDTAAHLLLMEVAWCLETDTATARSELLRRVIALREERGDTPDPMLMLLLIEVTAALDDVDASTGEFCEFCGAEGGGCAVCGG